MIANTGGRYLLGREGPLRVPAARAAMFIVPRKIGVGGVAGLAGRGWVPEEGCSVDDAGKGATREQIAKGGTNENCSCFIRRHKYIVALWAQLVFPNFRRRGWQDRC